MRGALFSVKPISLCFALILMPCLALAHAPPVDQTGHHIQLVLYADRILVDYAVVFSEIAYYRTLASMNTDGEGDVSVEEKTAYYTRMQKKILEALEFKVDGEDVSLIAEQVDDTNLMIFSYLFSAPVVPTRDQLHKVTVYNSLPIQRGEIMEYWLKADYDIRLEAADRWRKPDDDEEGIEGKRGVTVSYRIQERSVSTGAINPRQTGERIGGETGSGKSLKRFMQSKDLSPQFVIIGLLTAAILGALHALTPGHGKAVVAAYLVGNKGRIRDAVILGLVVTITHTFSVILLGLIALYASRYILPQDLFPWLGMSSGMMIILIGTWLLIRRLQSATYRHRIHPSSLEHDHAHGHIHSQDSENSHEHEHIHHEHIHHGHTHTPPERASLGSILSLGIAGGLVPCPDAMIVLLIAVAVHRLALGLAVIAAFSLGLGVVLVTIAVLIVMAKPVIDRFTGTGKWAYRLTIASSVVVILLGMAIAIQSLISGGIIIVNL